MENCPEIVLFVTERDQPADGGRARSRRYVRRSMSAGGPSMARRVQGGIVQQTGQPGNIVELNCGGWQGHVRLVATRCDVRACERMSRQGQRLMEQSRRLFAGYAVMAMAVVARFIAVASGGPGGAHADRVIRHAAPRTEGPRDGQRQGQAHPRCQRSATRRRLVFPADQAAMGRGRGDGRGDGTVQRRDDRHAASAGRKGACPSCLLRSGGLRGPALGHGSREGHGQPSGQNAPPRPVPGAGIALTGLVTGPRRQDRAYATAVVPAPGPATATVPAWPAVRLAGRRAPAGYLVPGRNPVPLEYSIGYVTCTVADMMGRSGGWLAGCCSRSSTC
jgi:hypothetical protein